MREDHRLGVLENRVLRRVFGPKRDEVSGSWRKLRNEMGGECGTCEGVESFIQGFGAET